jgi:ABC-type lipoprotein export system ATPase subunit
MIVMEVFEKLAREQGLTIVMVTHERSFAAMASRQIALRDGHIVSDVDQRSGDAPVFASEPSS